ncbi:hypothetical protein BJ165DRAFT_1493650, partial [Panaeolus papilionaceus]
MLRLCLAIASIGRAILRQSNKRHHLIVQAVQAILTKAPQAVGNDGGGGMGGGHYEEVLELVEQAGDDLLAREAALIFLGYICYYHCRSFGSTY